MKITILTLFPEMFSEYWKILSVDIFEIGEYYRKML